MPVTKSLQILRVSYGQLTCLVILLMLLQVTFSPPNSGQVMEGFLTLKARVVRVRSDTERRRGFYIVDYNIYPWTFTNTKL